MIVLILVSRSEILGSAGLVFLSSSHSFIRRTASAGAPLTILGILPFGMLRFEAFVRMDLKVFSSLCTLFVEGAVAKSSSVKFSNPTQFAFLKLMKVRFSDLTFLIAEERVMRRGR